MRASRVVTVSIAVAAIFLCWYNSVYAGPSLWPSNKGEICFNNITNGEFVRLAVMRTVGNNYIVQGFVTESLGGESLFNGNAIVNGSKILIHVTSSGIAGNLPTVSEVYGSIGRVELDASTLSGLVVSIGFHCEPAASPMCGFGYDGVQELNLAPCP